MLLRRRRRSSSCFLGAAVLLAPSTNTMCLHYTVELRNRSVRDVDR